MANDFESAVLAAVARVALSILALPFLLLDGLRSLRRLARTVGRLRAGSVNCPYCATPNTLNMMTRCPVCGAVEPGSRLRCSFCGALYTVIPCAGCGATLKVL